MTAPPSLAARLFAALIALVTLASLVVQFIVIRQEFGYSIPHSLWVMARFLTILTNAIAAVTFTGIAAGLYAAHPRWLAGLALWMALVAAGFHLLLRGMNPIEGLEVWSDFGFHTVAPLLVVLYWAAFAPKGYAVLRDLPFFLSWPAIYVSYALTRGGLDGRFPYPFLDPSAIGWEPVLWTVAKFGLGILIAGLIVIALDRIIGRIID